MATDYRYDQYNDVLQALTVTDSIYVIPSVTPYTLKLYEVPEYDSPSSMSMRVCDILTAAIATTTVTTITVANGDWFDVGKTITIDSEKLYVSAISDNILTVTRGYSSTTASVHSLGAQVFIEGSMTEVSATPASGQFYPDYSCSVTDDSTWNTGTILFNSGDAGKMVAVSYKGTGTLVDSRFINFKYPPWLYNLGSGADGDYFATGNVSLGGEYNYTNFYLGEKIDYLATAITSTTATTIYASTAIFAVGDILTIDSEQLYVSAVSTLTLTVTRGYNSTTAATHVISSTITSDCTLTLSSNYLVIRCTGTAIINGRIISKGKGTSTPTYSSGSYIGYGGGGGGGTSSTAGVSYIPSLYPRVAAAVVSTPSAENIAMALNYGPVYYGASGYTNVTGYNAGAGGGGVVILAKKIVFTGTINANGADGGTTSSTYAVGGGGGGVVILAANEVTNAGTITIAGGSGSYTGGAGWYKVLTL